MRTGGLDLHRTDCDTDYDTDTESNTDPDMCLRLLTGFHTLEEVLDPLAAALLCRTG